MKNKPYRFFLYLFLRIFLVFICLLPRKLVLVLASAGGNLAFVLVKKQRTKVIENLTKAFAKEKSQKEIFEIAREVFRHLAMTACDIMLLPKLTQSRLSEWVSWDKAAVDQMQKIKKSGKGLIISASHFGNWELLAAFLGLNGLPGSVIARRIYYERYNKILVSRRAMFGIETIYRDESPRKMLKVLKEGGVLGILADQDVDSVEGIFIDFFGRPAHTPVAIAKMAMAQGCPIVPVFLVRDGYKYRFILKEPIYATGELGKQEEIRLLTQKWTQELENMVRQYPAQWAWVHDRWKTRPADHLQDPNRKGLS